MRTLTSLDAALLRRLIPDTSIGSTIDPESIPIHMRIILACLQAVAIYNGVELFIIIFATFKRYQGLYFWSMIIATAGVLINALAFLINDFGLSGRHRMIPAAMIIVGWVPMTTGQAFVLYSRLHLLSVTGTKLRLVLAMIMVNALVGHVPTAIVIFGSNSGNPERFIVPYSIYEKVEVTLFFCQEMVLSGLYLWQCYGFWKTQRMRETHMIRNVIIHLVAVNLLVIALDVTILFFEFRGLYLLQTSYKAFVYSVKLKCEISILNRLVDFVRATQRVDAHWRITTEMEQEWVDTLRRTIGGSLPSTSAGGGGRATNGGTEAFEGATVLSEAERSRPTGALGSLAVIKTVGAQVLEEERMGELGIASPAQRKYADTERWPLKDEGEGSGMMESNVDVTKRRRPSEG